MNTSSATIPFGVSEQTLKQFNEYYVTIQPYVNPQESPQIKSKIETYTLDKLLNIANGVYNQLSHPQNEQFVTRYMGKLCLNRQKRPILIDVLRSIVGSQIQVEIVTRAPAQFTYLDLIPKDYKQIEFKDLKIEEIKIKFTDSRAISNNPTSNISTRYGTPNIGLTDLSTLIPNPSAWDEFQKKAQTRQPFTLWEDLAPFSALKTAPDQCETIFQSIPANVCDALLRLLFGNHYEPLFILNVNELFTIKNLSLSYQFNSIISVIDTMIIHCVLSSYMERSKFFQDVQTCCTFSPELGEEILRMVIVKIEYHCSLPVNKQDPIAIKGYFSALIHTAIQLLHGKLLFACFDLVRSFPSLHEAIYEFLFVSLKGEPLINYLLSYGKKFPNEPTIDLLVKKFLRSKEPGVQINADIISALVCNPHMTGLNTETAKEMIKKQLEIQAKKEILASPALMKFKDDFVTELIAKGNKEVEDRKLEDHINEFECLPSYTQTAIRKTQAPVI